MSGAAPHTVVTDVPARELRAGSTLIEQRHRDRVVPAGGSAVRVGVTDVSLSLGPLSVDIAQGALILNAAGLAASVEASLNLSVPGIDLNGGVITLDINTTCPISKGVVGLESVCQSSYLVTLENRKVDRQLLRSSPLCIGHRG